MKNKKMRNFLLALGIALVIPTSAFAEEVSSTSESAEEVSPLSAGWDWAGSRIFIGNHSDNPVNSGGGDFKVFMVDIPSKSTTYSLYEYDPNNADDFVGSFTFSASNKEWILRGIGNFVDGDNGKAEFYLKTSDTSDISNFIFYD